MNIPIYRIHYKLVISVTPKHCNVYERSTPPRRKDISERYFKRGRYDTFFSEKRRTQLAMSREANRKQRAPQERIPQWMRERHERMAVGKFIDRCGIFTYD